MIQLAGTGDSGLPPGELERWLAAISFGQIVRAVERVGTNAGFPAVITLYERWIASQPPNHPHLFAAWFNLGVEFALAGRRTDALAAYRSALALRPDFHAAAFNLGLILESLGEPEAALQCWARALQAEGDGTILLLTHSARVQGQLGRLAEAEATLRVIGARAEGKQGQGSDLGPH